MKKTGTRLAITGIVIGIIFGFIIRAGQSYIKSELVDLLQEEVAKSCNCNFEYDSISVSLLTLSAKGKNLKIVSGGETKLEFERIYARFGLSKIFEKIVNLSSLDLVDGYADGVSSESATYKFVDHLSAPLPPEKQNHDRLRLKLQKLSVSNSSFIEKFDGGELTGSDVSLLLHRTKSSDFALKPSVNKMKLIFFPDTKDEKEVLLGKVTASMVLLDDQIVFKSARMVQGLTSITASGISYTDQNNRLEGDIEYLIAGDLILLPDWIKLLADGKGKLSGTLSSPIVQGSLVIPKDISSGIELENKKVLKLNSGKGELFFDFNRGNPTAKVTQVRLTGPSASLTSMAPLLFEDSKLTAVFSLNSSKLNYNDLILENVRSVIKLSDLDNRTIPSIDGSIGSLSYGIFNKHDLRFSANKKEEVVSLDISHNSEQYGNISSKGNLLIKPRTAYELDNFKIRFDKFRPFQIFADETSDSILNTVRITGDGNLKGLLDLTSLAGNANLQVVSKHFEGEAALHGNASINKGKFKVNVENNSKTLALGLGVDLHGKELSKARVVLNNFKAREYNPDLECISLSLTSEYNFNALNALRGNGKLDLNALEFGCTPHTVTLDKPVDVFIKNGEFSFPIFSLSGPETTITSSGFISLEHGYDFKVNGSFLLSPFLSFLPELDDLQGVTNAVIQISGELDNPVFEGSAEIREGEIASEAINLSGTEIYGELALKNQILELEGLSGKLNEGAVEVSGIVDLLNIADSSVALTFDDVLIEPDENTSAVLAGSIALDTEEESRSVISGEVILQSAEFQKNLDLTTLLKTLTEYVFTRAELKKRTKDLPDVLLDLTIQGPRNLFIFTNLLGTELKTDIKVSGTLREPLFEGSMETLSGWFGIKHRRFEITSGILRFSHGQPEPQLDLVGETYVRARTGETILVILEAQGSLSDPRIELSSDSGHSQKELLTLVTGAGTIGGQIVRSEFEEELKASAQLSTEDDSLKGLYKILRTLTRIDNISLEPDFNIRRGLIEPSIVATKRISDRAYLVGQTFLSGTGNESKLRLVYNLFPLVSIAGIVDTITSEDQTALGADLTYTILTGQKRFLSISIEGNSNFSNSELLRELRLSEDSRIPIEELEAVQLELKNFYKSRGYFDAEINCNCVDDGAMCRDLNLIIKEGALSKVSDLVIKDGYIPQEIKISDLLELPEDQVADQKFIDGLHVSLLRKLRTEGYISARVTVEYLPLIEADKRTASIKVIPGKPVSFSFYDNKTFSSKDFLNTINLFSRKQPFGNNTIHILIENIERMYREAGYLFASISFYKDEVTDPNRILFNIFIREEEKVSVSGVEFNGLTSITRDQLVNMLSKNEANKIKSIVSPKFAIAEELEDNARIIRELLIEEGFPDASVVYKIEPSEDSKTVVIQYQIVEGKRLYADWIVVEGLPGRMKAPEKPLAPYSIPKGNRYIYELTDDLKRYGYRNPNIWSEIADDPGLLIVHVEPGERTHIDEIIITGLGRVDEKVVNRTLTIREGDPWDDAQLTKSKRALLKLGLFSRVTLKPRDGELDSEKESLHVNVIEKALRSLEVGGGVNSELGAHIFGEATDRDTIGDGKSLTLRADLYYDPTINDISQGAATFRYTDPFVFDSDFTLTEDLRFQRLDLSTLEYDLDRISLASYFSRSWDNGLALSIGHTILEENLDNVSPDAVLGPLDTGTVDLSFLSGRFTFDRRDNPLNPQAGYTINFDYQFSSEALLSDADFYSFGARVSTVTPLSAFSRFSVAASSRAAAAWTFGETDIIPISERYYAGGRNSVRGFRENSLGPLGSMGSVLGGDTYFVNNFELRYRLTDTVSLHSFFDAGTVFLRDNSLSIDDLRTSSGAGVRYLSPIGPIGIDLGVPLDERSGEPSMRVHFSIGSNF